MISEKFTATRTIAAHCLADVSCASDAGDESAVLMLPFTYEIWDETANRLICYCDNDLWLYRSESEYAADGFAWDFDECVSEWRDETGAEVSAETLSALEFIAGGNYEFFKLTESARGEMLAEILESAKQKLIDFENDRNE